MLESRWIRGRVRSQLVHFRLFLVPLLGVKADLFVQPFDGARLELELLDGLRLVGHVCSDGEEIGLKLVRHLILISIHCYESSLLAYSAPALIAHMYCLVQTFASNRNENSTHGDAYRIRRWAEAAAIETRSD